MRRLVTFTLCLALLALPIGLASSLLSSALLRVGLWIESAPSTLLGSAPSARERLETRLRRDGAVGAASLDAWHQAIETASIDPVALPLPYAETAVAGFDGNLTDDLDAGARVFDVTLDDGDVLRIATSASAGALGGTLVEVIDPMLASPDDPEGSRGNTRDPSGGSVEASFGPASFDERIEPSRPGLWRLRVQVTPGAIGRFAVAFETRTRLDFPVETARDDAVRSFFGMPRDGGAREHHGIDIFAPRGTSVLAAADGIVARTGESSRGGLHVWQRALDDGGDRLGGLYYAHLDRIDVVAGERVTRGTRLGTVGNTGNARTTPPHLHFGLYRRFEGPVDPLPYTGTMRTPELVLEPGEAAPRWMRVTSARANLRGGPGTAHEVLTSLERGDIVRVDGIARGGRWLRVHAGDGVDAWVARSLLERADEPTGPPSPAALGPVSTVSRPYDVLASPRAGAPVLASVAAADAGTTLAPVGRHGAALRVRTAQGLLGWLVPDEAS